MQGIRYGADTYMPKPFSPTLLVSRSLALLRQHERLKTAYANNNKDEASSIHSEALITNDRDRKFREIVDMKIHSNLSNPDFLVDDLAHATGYGRSQFYSKMVEITGKTPKEYIREQRMNRAAELLRQGGAVNISEVAYQVGFSDPLYFSRCFKSHFGMTPSKYQKS